MVMIYSLGEEPLGRLLDLLPAGDLRSARQAAKPFDRASREHTERLSTMKLTPSNAGGARPGPDWARHPRLWRLVLGNWSLADGEALRGLFASSGEGALAGLEQVEGEHRLSGEVSAATWAAILGAAPNVTTVRLPRSPLGTNDDGLEVLETIGRLAPLLVDLQSDWDIRPRTAACISKRMTALRALSLCDLYPGDVRSVTSPDEFCDAAGDTWQALPCSRLTALWLNYAKVPEPLLEGLSWPCMRMSGIVLHATCIETLARGLPYLQRLGIFPVGDWERPARMVAFPLVTSARIAFCCASFSNAARLSRLLPAVEQLNWDGGDAPINCDFSGLARLSSLKLFDDCCDDVGVVGPRAWDALYNMPQLRHLALALPLDQLPRLARLPAGLEVLGVKVACAVGAGGEYVWADGESGNPFDAAQALLAASSPARRLRLLSLCAPGAFLSHAALARLVGARGFRALEVCMPAARLHDISALAMMQGLRWLPVGLAPGVGPGDPDLARLLSEHMARGLRITVCHGTGWEAVRTNALALFFDDDAW